MEENYNNFVHLNTEDMARVQSAFLNRVYMWMTGGLAATGAVAWSLGTQKIDFMLKHQNLVLPLIVVEVLLVICLSWMINKINAAVAGVMFAAYSLLNGVTLSWIFLAYQFGSVANVFFITCATFAGMSAYGYTFLSMVEELCCWKPIRAASSYVPEGRCIST